VRIITSMDLDMLQTHLLKHISKMFFTKNLKIIYWYQLENARKEAMAINKVHILTITTQFTTFISDNMFTMGSFWINEITVLEEYLPHNHTRWITRHTTIQWWFSFTFNLNYQNISQYPKWGMCTPKFSTILNCGQETLTTLKGKVRCDKCM
jgi:hypothetical protein